MFLRAISPFLSTNNEILKNHLRRSSRRLQKGTFTSNTLDIHRLLIGFELRFRATGTFFGGLLLAIALGFGALEKMSDWSL
jgi:hypothetical protein